eukprot:330142-Pyramimonas_sp.AAC.1
MAPTGDEPMEEPIAPTPIAGAEGDAAPGTPPDRAPPIAAIAELQAGQAALAQQLVGLAQLLTTMQGQMAAAR